MKKIIFTAICGLLTADLHAAGALNFTDADFFRQLKTAPASAAAAPVSKPARAKTGGYVRVSGHVNLSGNGFVPYPNGGFASVTLTGWGNFRDGSGAVASNNTYLSVPVSLWLYSNQNVFQTVWPNVSAQFYRNGKPVGSASLTGALSVSGWPSSGFVSLSGSGYLTGSIYVEDGK